jgi:hypothetical protein
METAGESLVSLGTIETKRGVHTDTELSEAPGARGSCLQYSTTSLCARLPSEYGRPLTIFFLLQKPNSSVTIYPPSQVITCTHFEAYAHPLVKFAKAALIFPHWSYSCLALRWCGLYSQILYYAAARESLLARQREALAQLNVLELGEHLVASQYGWVRRTAREKDLAIDAERSSGPALVFVLASSRVHTVKQNPILETWIHC